MKRKIVGAFLAAAVTIGGGMALASDASGTAAGPSGTAVRKFQKDTFELRDKLAAKRADLQDEYQKAQPDRARIAGLEKDIVDLETRIHAVAQQNGIRRGPGRGRGMGSGMGMGYAMMGNGGGPGNCGCRQGW